MRISNPPRKITSNLRAVKDLASNQRRRLSGWMPSPQTTMGKALIGVASVLVLGGIAAGVAAPFVIAATKSKDNSTVTDTTTTTATTTTDTSTTSTTSTTATTTTTTSTTSTTTTSSTTSSTSTTTTTTTKTTSTTSTTTTATTTTTTKTTSTTSTTTTATTTTATTTTTGPVCTPFWSMPSTDQGTNLTYFNDNTQISGSQSRTGCALVRASASNADNIIYDIGSDYSTWGSPSGCNEHFALSIIDSAHVTIYGMCGTYDNPNIATGQSSLYDGNFHQICATYDSTTALLCIYQDLYSPTCLTRTNPLYNTGLGSVRIGWWPDGNRGFVSSGGGLIKSVSLFNTALNQSGVAYVYQNNFGSG